MYLHLKMCEEVAMEIINNIFWVKYEPTMQKNKPWYENLNTFLVKEWDCLPKTADQAGPFSREEIEMIVSNAFKIFIDKLGINDDQVKKFQEEVEWSKFDDMIGHYTCMLETNVKKSNDNISSYRSSLSFSSP